jgi:hypothetical protein
LQQLENDIVAAFRLLTTPGLLSLGARAADQMKVRHFLWEGLVSKPETEAQKQSSLDFVNPPADIEPIIIRVGAATFGEYIDTVLPEFKATAPRITFLLLTFAIDGFLERKGLSGTLGAKLHRARGTLGNQLPLQLWYDVIEFLRRRNDDVHTGGNVGADYATCQDVLRSSWVVQNGPPLVASRHAYTTAYLYQATSAIVRLTRMFP